MEEGFVEEAKQTLLRNYAYPFFIDWVDPGQSCGWELAETKDLQALNDIFGTMPDWQRYDKSSHYTQQAMELFESNADSVPFGLLSSPSLNL